MYSNKRCKVIKYYKKAKQNVDLFVKMTNSCASSTSGNGAAAQRVIKENSNRSTEIAIQTWLRRRTSELKKLNADV
ncbi:hypothetical protein NQ317_003724 [Molorchus minor]|uniref:Uncharacterized protein n=1 Tax=Molorchus minor TaxID=1323400 RepID=A0ABQ9IU62_9CUCU|nr:hypothetical protein NQ317_003724 [Molorchus minor]